MRVMRVIIIPLRITPPHTTITLFHMRVSASTVDQSLEHTHQPAHTSTQPHTLMELHVAGSIPHATRARVINGRPSCAVAGRVWCKAWRLCGAVVNAYRWLKTSMCSIPRKPTRHPGPRAGDTSLLTDTEESFKHSFSSAAARFEWSPWSTGYTPANTMHLPWGVWCDAARVCCS